MPKTMLVIPKSDAERQLTSQIANGESLIDQITETDPVLYTGEFSDIDALWLEKTKYTNNNITMLEHMFNELDVSQGFRKFNSRITYPVEDALRELRYLKAVTMEEVNELRSIYERLTYVPEMSPKELSLLAEELSPPAEASPALAYPSPDQSVQRSDSNQPKTFRQKIDDHPMSVLIGVAVASAGITASIMIGLQSGRIEQEKSKLEQEKSRYEAIIENNKKDYEEQLRELRARVKELESRASGKNSNTTPSDK